MPRDQSFRKYPSQFSNPPKTFSNGPGWRTPSRWRARTVGKVVTPCARKAPGFRKGTRTAISNGEPRRVVVCGTTVMRARSWSPKAVLTTRAGRVLPARPKSMSQTSPRRGGGIFVVERFKHRGRSGANLFICQRPGIEGQRAAQDLAGKRALLVRRKMLEGFQQSLSFTAHALIVA